MATKIKETKEELKEQQQATEDENLEVEQEQRTEPRLAMCPEFRKIFSVGNIIIS